MAEERKVTIKYKAGHSYDFKYEKTDLHCPNCGKKQVWVDVGEADFYAGPDYACNSCCHTFNLPHMSNGNESYEDKQLFEQLKKEK